MWPSLYSFCKTFKKGLEKVDKKQLYLLNSYKTFLQDLNTIVSTQIRRKYCTGVGFMVDVHIKEHIYLQWTKLKALNLRRITGASLIRCRGRFYGVMRPKWMYLTLRKNNNIWRIKVHSKQNLNQVVNIGVGIW